MGKMESCTKTGIAILTVCTLCDMLLYKEVPFGVSMTLLPV